VASTGKRRTTRAKLTREAKLREKRIDKQARKAARRLSADGDAGYEAFGPEELGTESEPLDGELDDAEREPVAVAVDLEGRAV
jgi:hypothetical protein